MLIDIEKLSNSVPDANEGSYVGENGLLYCAKCRTPKETIFIVPELKINRKVNQMCKCAIEKDRQEKENRQREEFNKLVTKYRRAGFPEADMTDYTFDNDDKANEKITTAMQNYVKYFASMKEQGKGLLLYGDVGTGKTFHAACVVNALIDKGFPCLMTNFARLVNTLQGMFEEKQEYIDSLNRFSLIVIDDLGAERQSEFMQEQVYNIIDSRYRAGLPLIITTNLTIEEIKKPQCVGHARIYDRLLEMCHPIEVAGISRRRQHVRENYAEMQKILGL